MIELIFYLLLISSSLLSGYRYPKCYSTPKSGIHRLSTFLKLSSSTSSSSAGLKESTEQLSKSLNYQLLSPTKIMYVPFSSILGISSFGKKTESEIVYDGRSSEPLRGTLLVFLTHLGDLASFELAQQIKHYLPQLTSFPRTSEKNSSGLQLCVVAPGSIDNAQKFCDLTGFPMKYLHLDPSGDLYKMLGLYNGFLGDVGFINPYLKFLPMLAGIGSPGTIPEVLRGYVGDSSASSTWIKEALRFVPHHIDSYEASDARESTQRPFELATLRLQNMMDVMKHWEELTPSDKSLITQFGGAFVLSPSGDVFGGAFVLSPSGDVVYEYRDTGILKYVSIKEAVKQAFNIDLID
eukprot:gene10609-11551_t